MRTSIIALVTTIAAPLTLAAARVSGPETVGATNLLTAERRAREASERLRLPETGPAHWKAGGRGWTPAWSPEIGRPGATPQNDRPSVDAR